MRYDCVLSGEFHQIDSISEVELTAENNFEGVNMFTSGEINITIDNSNIDDIMKAILGQGRYNAMKLKEDGYLSEHNGWTNS